MFKLFIFVLGTIVGSFLNVCIYRIPLGESVVYPPSYCPRCKAKINALDMFPILNYLWLRGRCQKCSSKFSIRYPVVELLTGIILLGAFIKFGLTWELLSSFVLICCLMVSTFTDLECGIIPDKVLMSTLAVGFVLKVLIFPGKVWDGTMGLFLGGVILLMLSIVSRGGIGGGDIKLFAVVGWFLGAVLTLLSLLFSFIFAGFAGSIMIASGLKMIKDTIPFGPFIALSSLISLFVGNEIIAWYLRLLF